jgi:hypothetical protein
MPRSRIALALVAVVAATAAPTAALADPSGPNVQENWTLTCGGQTVVTNSGTVTNASHQAFVVGSTSIFVINYFAVTIGTDTFVLVDAAPGLNQQSLVTCTTTVRGESVLLRGFFTPAT